MTPRNFYLWLVSGLGVFLVVRGVFLLPTYDMPLVFALLVLLAIAAQITATSLIGGNVTVEVGTAVSMATISLYGPVAATIVAAAGVTAITIINLRQSWKGWLGAAERIGFNIGMSATAIYLAGLIYHAVLAIFDNNLIIGTMLAWLAAAVVNDQVNLWLLIGLLHLQSGVKPLDIWRQHRWAIPINVLVISVGGGVLAFAVAEFDIIGIGIFFLPIVLSAYAFRLYVEQTKQQMEHLEELVAERTRDLEKANGDLASANNDLAALSKEKDAFLAVLTHDMRTPLTSIKGYASILRDRELEREQQVHISKIILRGQDTLLEIVNNILEIEKLQSGIPMLLERAEFDLAMLTQVVAETLLAPAREKQITLSYDEIPDPIMVDGDRQKVKRVITNLISNAIKYTPDGGAVWVKTWINGRYAYLEVKDNGYGIPADELPHIFDRYSRVKGHRSLAVGTGLGLAIVKSLVEAHDGDIDVISEVDVGSTFTLKLPVKAVAES
ncbi:MAG: HAMP domain-containing histidine kinase [Anaerolineales bacterium]|nr:HAMP domain-containing histidine kinase [Anaerolineales bacterium]MCA9974912.1 HAMP domain-containing histidine kinase [Anaerolineales bacterium]